MHANLTAGIYLMRGRVVTTTRSDDEDNETIKTGRCGGGSSAFADGEVCEPSNLMKHG